MATRDIAIIGSGLSGLSLALSLKKYNISSTIYEFRPSSYTAGGEIGLSPNALRVLDHLSVYEHIRPQGFNSDSFHLMNRTGKTLGLMQQGSLFGYSAIRLPRRCVRGELLKEVERQGIKVCYEKKFVKLEEGEEGVKLWFEDGEMVDASLVVGADGLRSSVRKYVDADRKPCYSGTMVLYGTASKSVVDERLSANDQKVPNPSMLFGKEGSFTVWPRDYNAEELGYIVNLQLPDRSKDEWRKLEEDKEGLRDLLKERFCRGDWAGAGSDHVINMVPSLPSWRSSSGKVILIGDAAHAIPPSGGQGGAMSFEDAESLAYALSTLDKDPSALSSWETHRKERVKQVIDFNNLSSKLREASQYSLVQTIREWFIWALLRVKGQEGYRWLYGYDAEVEMSKL